MSTVARNVSVQSAQAQMSMQRPTQGTLFATSSLPIHRAPELNSNHMRSQRTSSPKAWTASPIAPQRYASDETFVGVSEKADAKATPGPGVVRSSSGSQQALSPPRSGLGRSPQQQVDGQCSSGLHFDCPTCLETRRRGFVLCRLPCGHTVRAQILDSELPAGCWGGGSGPRGARSESPPLLSAQQRERDHTVTSSPPRSIMRQVSGIRNNVPSVGILAPHGNQLPPGACFEAPLSPPRGPASPSSPQHTPGTMYRKATSSLTSFNIPRDGGGPPPNVEVALTQQMTSRSSGGGACSGLGGSSQGGVGGEGRAVPGPPSREASTREKPRRHERELVRTEMALDARRGTCESLSGPTVAEIVTDSRGDVLHRMCNVILLSPQSTDKEQQQLKVRGQIIGTYWDERDIGPTLDHPGEVQVMVTYVDSSERSTSLLFPTKYATNFSDTETAEGNIIKWK
eukprot:CAMPEP_0169208568 /NCGR_PEP_ID=MMETSP1016-20121227/14197_1 /TAXON_ID=342587 /ORGANISM="Karlodinium micrum, Strain CCMP2283" /LENGTH=455 /DNA_ID=CAMNT_0009285943 /DNA_START=18 /DNA_END=1383 /DNA_ORIENTATION=-